MIAGVWTRRLKRSVLGMAERFGYDIERHEDLSPPYRLVKRIQLGGDGLRDAATILGRPLQRVIDVGAHVGQTAVRIADANPLAVIYCFEPDPRSYAELARTARGSDRVHPINAAVGDHDGEATLFVNRFSQTNSLLKAAEGAERFLVDPGQMMLEGHTRVPLLTLDRFCAERAIDGIDLLKIDTQGYELRVLDGARELMARRQVPLLYLEVSFVPYYEGQPLFPEVYTYLYERGYRLVWLYESGFRTHFYSVGANALFVHEAAGEKP
jgi:FkbM family methyltransferase